MNLKKGPDSVTKRLVSAEIITKRGGTALVFSVCYSLNFKGVKTRHSQANSYFCFAAIIPYNFLKKVIIYHEIRSDRQQAVYKKPGQVYG